MMLPAILYLSFRYYATFKSHLQKWLLPTVLLSFYVYPLSALIDFYITGSIDLLNYPQLLAYWFWFGLIFVFQLITWVIITDLIKVVTNYFYEDKNVISRWHHHALVVLFATIFLFTAAKTYFHTTQVQTEHHTIYVENLPQPLEGLQIVHITDIQGDEYTG
ncbi:MAG: hypothetical protein GWN62_21420, partial [Aliifodinibius sp.]|nr:hypothetical protein [Fodinibius sp.]